MQLPLRNCILQLESWHKQPYQHRCVVGCAQHVLDILFAVLTHAPCFFLQSQLEQLAEATTKINRLIAKLEQSKQQLDRANKEIRELKEAAQVCGCGKTCLADLKLKA